MLTRRLISLWQDAFGARQTQYLVLCLLTAYGTYLFWLGIRPIVMVSGGLICVLALLVWLLTPSAPVTAKDDSNLLDKATFHSRLESSRSLPRGVRLNDIAIAYWQKTYDQVEAIHQVTVAIAAQESLFIPDLLDTLHTVLDLSTQFSKAFSAAKKMKTSSYRKVAQQQLRASTYRLSQTYKQLQELHDQLLAEGMETDSPSVASGVSQRLQTLISTNKSELVSH